MIELVVMSVMYKNATARYVLIGLSTVMFVAAVLFYPVSDRGR